MRNKLKRQCKQCHISIDDRGKSGLCKRCSHYGKLNNFYGKKHSLKTRKLMRDNHYNCFGKNNSFYNKKHSKTSLLKMKTTHLKNWKHYDEEKRLTILQNWIIAGRKKEQTKIEKIICNLLTRFGIKFKTNQQIGLYNVDILFDNKIIECFGDYWHYNPKRYISNNNKIRNKRNKDNQKRKFLLKLGFKYLQLWEYDIKHNLNKVKSRVKTFAGGQNV